MHGTYGELDGSFKLELSELKLLSKSDRPQYTRRGRYKYTESTYTFSFQLNPGMTSAKNFAGVVRQGEQTPFTTEQAVRYYLSQPRKRFTWLDDDDNIVLETPKRGRVTDGHNGPLVNVLSITEVIGSGTILCEWAITTFLLETDRFGAAEPVLTEHSWETTHSIDENYYTTRTINGRIDLNTSYLENNNLTPDDYRRWLFPEPPAGYKRMNVNVVAQEDGSSLTYQVVDRELRCSIIRRGITDIECIEKAGVKAVGLHDLGANAGVSTMNIIGSVADAVPGLGGRPTPSRIINAIRGSSSSALEFYRNNLPVRTKNIYIKVTGTPNTNLRTLRDTAYDVARFRMGSVRLLYLNFSNEINETHDVKNGIVELLITQISGLGDQLLTLNAIAGFQNGFSLVIPDVTGMIPINNDIEPNIAPWDNRQPVAAASNLPNDNGSRGSSLAIAVAAELASSSGVQPQRHQDRIRNRSFSQDPQS